MNELNTVLGLYKFNEEIESINLKLMQELETANEHGIKYFIVGDLSEKVTGFKRGERMSTIITTLNKLKKTNIKISIKNTFEDINFYKRILEKVPNIGFTFDKENAEQFSNNSIEEWNEFIDSLNVYSF